MADTTKAYNGILLPNFAGYDGLSQAKDGTLDANESSWFVAEALAGSASTASIAIALHKHCSPISKAVLEAVLPEKLRIELNEEEIARMALASTDASLSPAAKDGLVEARRFVTGELRNPDSSLNGHMDDGANLGEAALRSLSEKPINTSTVDEATHEQLMALAPLLDDTQLQIAKAVQEWNADQSAALPSGITVPSSEDVCSNLRQMLSENSKQNFRG